MNFLKRHWHVIAAIAVGMAIEAATDAGYSTYIYVKSKLSPAGA